MAKGTPGIRPTWDRDGIVTDIRMLRTQISAFLRRWIHATEPVPGTLMKLDQELEVAAKVLEGADEGDFLDRRKMGGDDKAMIQ